jgi:hypothetical protein
MKVKIGNYTGWFGPHQLAELLCFWVKPVKDEYGFKRKPDWVHDFGEWLTHGSVRSEREVGEVYKFMGEERPVTWLYKFLLWIENIKPDRKIKVKVNPGSMNANSQIVADGNFFTEDVSLSMFMQHLIRMAV